MKVEIWRTEAWCGMIMGWVPPEAIPYAFDAVSKECWHVDKKRESILNDQCHDVKILHIAAKAEKDRKDRLRAAAEIFNLEKLAPSAADAAAPEPKNMPTQFHGCGPKPPPEPEQDPETLELKPRWIE